MPKNSSYSRRRNNNYNNDGFVSGDKYLEYHENYPSKECRNGLYDYAGNYNYKNRRQKPYDVAQRTYRQNYGGWQKSWKGQLNDNQKYIGHNQQPFVQNQNKFTQHAGDRLLAALSKTANVFSADNANIKKCNIQPTIAQTQEQAVAKGKSPSTSLDEDIATQVAFTEKSPLLKFHFIYEESEQAYKTFKNAQKLEKQREENSQDATTQKVTADEATVKDVKLFQTREELIAKTKETTLYKAYQELVRKDTLPDKKYPKTPETAIATSRWKENYFKPWKFDLTQFGYRFLNRIFEENDEDASGE